MFDCFSVLSQDMAGKNVSKMTYFVPGGMFHHNSIHQSIIYPDMSRWQGLGIFYLSQFSRVLVRRENLALCKFNALAMHEFIVQCSHFSFTQKIWH